MINSGFRPEPDSPKHWSFEELLLPKLAHQTTKEVAAVSEGNVDLRPFTSPRHSQGHTSSCVAQATCKALEIKRIMVGLPHVDLSRLAVYYLARDLMVPKETGNDGGTYISHAFDAMRRFGVPPETDWPWDLGKICHAPSWGAMRKAYVSKLSAFYKIYSSGQRRIQMVIEALRAGNPVVFGTYTNKSWKFYQKGQVLKPILKSESSGRHATCLVGYKDGIFIGENSWGPRWGDDGFYLMDPEAIAFDGSRDLWVPQAGYETYEEQGE